MTFPREVQLLSSDLRHAYVRPLMVCKYITCVIFGKLSESEREKAERNIQMAMTSIVLTSGSFYSPSKSLEIFPGACPVIDRRLNVCFIGLNMHRGFEKNVYFIEQWGL